MEEWNAKVEMSLNETIKVAREEELRLPAASSQRRRVVEGADCSCASTSVPDDDVRILMCVFLFSLTAAAVNIFRYERFTHDPHLWNFLEELVMSGMITLVMFAVGVVIGVLVKKMMKKNTDPAPQRKPAVRTISALIQEV